MQMKAIKMAATQTKTSLRKATTKRVSLEVPPKSQAQVVSLTLLSCAQQATARLKRRHARLSTLIEEESAYSTQQVSANYSKRALRHRDKLSRLASYQHLELEMKSSIALCVWASARAHLPSAKIDEASPSKEAQNGTKYASEINLMLMRANNISVSHVRIQSRN